MNRPPLTLFFLPFLSGTSLGIRRVLFTFRPREALHTFRNESPFWRWVLNSALNRFYFPFLSKLTLFLLRNRFCAWYIAVSAFQQSGFRNGLEL